MTDTSVLIVTAQHFATQSRKVDLHFMADELIGRGIRADFLSLRLSRISALVGDERWGFARTRPLNRWTTIGPLQDEFIWFNLIHPIRFGNRFLNAISSAGYRFYGALLPNAVRRQLSKYSHILIESGISLLLLPTLRRLAPKACIIYHAADRLDTIGTHPLARAVLHKNFDKIDLVHIMAEGLRSDLPASASPLFLTHGIAKERFDQSRKTPYDHPQNAVSVGDMLFDADVIRTLAVAFPDWNFHLFGRRAHLGEPYPNVVEHGEQPFDTIAPFIKFADIGLAPYTPKDGADYLSQSSLKMIQYTYCQLPIVAPEFAAAGRPHVQPYRPADPGSMVAAFERAISYDRGSIDTSSVLSWSEKIDRLFLH